MTDERCPSCGAPAGGRAGCQAVFDELNAQVYMDVRRAAVHPLVIDAYSMQHAEEYGRSAKSYAAHLLRLYCGVELNGDAATYAAIPAWLNGLVPLVKPDVPSARGTLTVASVATVTIEEYAEAVRAWAADVWRAYGSQHALAREWLDAALKRK